MFKLIFAIIIVVLFALLLVHFAFTLYTIFRGAAFLPTPKKRVQEFLALGRPTSTDIVMDFGSGDGRVLTAFAAAGAKECIGYEVHPFLVLVSKIRAFVGGYKNINISLKDVWTADLSDVDILTVFLVPIFLEKLHEKAKREMKPGSTILTYWYHFEDWKPEETLGKVQKYVLPTD